MKPTVRSLDGLLQICYDLPHRVHTTKAYPLTSPNGSTIIVYGHEQGLRIIWRGGRPFQYQQSTEQNKPKPNGAGKDTIISLSSSDEEPAGADEPYQDSPRFEEEEEEYDPSEPYQPIIQTLGLTLGVGVLHLAFPHLPANIQKTSLESLPSLMSEKFICAVACSDFTIRVLAIPLMPPSPQSKAKAEYRKPDPNLSAGKSFFGEQMILLTGGTAHQSIPKGVSISITASSLEDEEDIEMEDEVDTSRKLAVSQAGSRSRSRSRMGRDQLWDILVASHSADLSGLLLVYRIPFAADGTSISAEQRGPWRTQYLASPAVSVEFNSAICPAPRHSRLLVAEAKGVVRVLDCLPRSSATRGFWLVSLHTEFEPSQGPMPRRKAILDARWVLGGKSILVLLVDGKYGVWDIEDAGPKPTDAGKASRAFTTFAIGGWVGDLLKSQALTKSQGSSNETRPKLAPMTPSTRKMKQEALFTGPTMQPEGPARGGLFISQSQDASSTRTNDECVLLWYGCSIMIIPSLFAHWQNRVRASGSLFGSGARGEPKAINNVRLGGELCNEIGLIPCHKDETNVPANQPEVLVTGEHRLLIISPPRLEPPPPQQPTPPPLTSSADQQLLAMGELDVRGMDRILGGMSNGYTPTRLSRSSYGNGKDYLVS